MSNEPLNILIADDHQLVAEVLALHLSHSDDMKVTVALTLPEALRMAEAAGGYDVVLLDFRMPGMDGLEGLAEMLVANRGKPVAMISGNFQTGMMSEAMRLGASTCIPKSMAIKSFVAVVRLVASGGTFLPFLSDDTHLASADRSLDLSDRERHILEKLSTGLTNKEIARELDLGETTIKMYVRAVCNKLRVRNRTQAALVYKKLSVVE